jgi:class 3 adenylate cyclase/ActR/RegA family two-component response regulator
MSALPELDAAREPLRVVIVQSVAKDAQTLAGFFNKRRDLLWQVTQPAEALTLIQRHRPDLVIVDLHLTGTEWLNLLRQLRQDFPATRVIVTNKYPDLNREILAKEQGVHVFLRQPFSRQWVERAMARLGDDSARDEGHLPVVRATAGYAKGLPRVRFPVGLKIALTYVLLAGVFAAGAAYQPTTLTRLQAIALVAAGFVVIITLGALLAGRITRQLTQMVRASNQVALGNLEVKVDTSGDDEVAVLAHAFNYMVAGLQEGFIYRDLLGRTVSPEVREQLRLGFASGNLRLEGQNVVASVLLSDIRGFTSLSENEQPTTVLAWLNEYFGGLVPIIGSYGGVVDKFEGDALLAFFGILPRSMSPQESAYQACLAAVAMLKRIDRINDQRAANGLPPFITGIGLNTGPVTAGGLGAADRLNYTVIGDAVNTAQRLVGFTGDFGTSAIVISENTASALEERAAEFRLELLGTQSLKGKREEVIVYRLLGLADAVKVS